MTAAFHMVGARPRGTLLPGNDPLFDKVTLLWHWDGPNGANSPVYDHSNYRWGHTNAGGASFSTGAIKFGISSGLFDGADHIRIVPGIQAIGTSDFTIEMWVNHRVIGNTDYLFDYRGNNADVDRPALRLNATKLEYVVSSAARITSSYVPVVGTWYHLAVCRVAGQTRMFVNGVQTGATYADAHNYTTATERPRFAADGAGPNNFFDGYLDDVRITHAGRYAANFTVPAEAFPNYGEKLTLGQALPYLGLETGIKFTLDAAMSGSHKPGNNRWYDVSNLLGSTRSGGLNFYLGSSATIGAAEDPTWNGVENGGSANEFFSFDGGDRFDFDTSMPSWMDGLHKDGALFSAFTWVYLSSLGVAQSIFGTHGNNLAGHGAALIIAATNVVQFSANNGSGTAALQIGTGTIPLQVGWNAIGFSIHELSQRVNFFVNGTMKQFTNSYVGPSTSPATYRLQIGARGNANLPMAAGSRMASIAMWDQVELTPANFDEIFKYTRSVYGL